MAYTLEEDNSDDSYNLAGGIYGTWWLCQTFTASGSYDLKKVSIPLCSEGTPPPLYLEIWSTSGGEPDSVLKSQLITGELSAHPSHDWVDVVIDAAYTTTEDDVYAIVVRSDGTGDGDNRGRWWYDSSGSWPGAEGWSNDSGETWHMTASADHLFKIYSELALPGKPTNVSPENEASDITLHSTTGTWASGGNTDSYNVYYGTLSGFLDLVEEGVTDLSLTLVDGNFSVYGKISYWRVDAVNEAGTTTGDEWYFTTMVFDPVLPTGVTLDGDGVPTGTPTGENNMMTVRRLVAAARNKIFYEA